MGLNLSTVHQRPYMARDNQEFVKRKKDEEGSKSPAQTAREEEASQNARSRGLQYAEGAADEFTRTSVPSQTQTWLNNVYPQNYYSAAPQNVAPNTAMYASLGTSINIAQILKDFKNTAVAIGTPEDLKEEVNGYLELVEKQVMKDNPNTRLIKSNLKNASTILDNYISKTLNKDSRVVENWVDALFMQNIDFRYNEEDINEQFLVKFPESATTQAEKTKAPEQISAPQEEQEVVYSEEAKQPAAVVYETKVFVPQDDELKALFIKSKKLAFAKDPKKAIETFQQALNRANEIGDTETKSKIYFEVGKIYDNYDFPAQALKSYYKSLQNTEDNNIKTRAHYSMAQIYDEVNQIEPALDHYFVSVGYGGETDNKAAQSTSLTRMGNIFSDMYEEDAFEFLTAAKELAQDTDNLKVRGFVSSSLGRAYERFGEPQEALKSYSEAVKNYTDANSPAKTAQNYLSAADIMIDFNSYNKARGLLNKAQHYAEAAGEEALLSEINARLAQIAA